jgi:hypothetical protein
MRKGESVPKTQFAPAKPNFREAGARRERFHNSCALLMCASRFFERWLLVPSHGRSGLIVHAGESPAKRGRRREEILFISALRGGDDCFGGYGPSDNRAGTDRWVLGAFEHFRNARRLFKSCERWHFLRKKPLERVLSVNTNSENAPAAFRRSTSFRADSLASRQHETPENPKHDYPTNIDAR